MITGCEKWYIACLIGGNHFVWKEIPRNDEFISDMRAQAIIFWNNLQSNIPPEVDGSESTAATIDKKNYEITKNIGDKMSRKAGTKCPLTLGQNVPEKFERSGTKC